MVATVSLRSLPVGCVCIRRVFISTKAKQPLIKASAHTTLDKLLATNMPTRNIYRKKKKTSSNKFPSKCLESWARQQHNQWSLSSARHSGIKWIFMIADDIWECKYALLWLVYACVVRLQATVQTTTCLSSVRKTDTENDKNKNCKLQVCRLHIKQFASPSRVFWKKLKSLLFLISLHLFMYIFRVLWRKNIFLCSFFVAFVW